MMSMLNAYAINGEFYRIDDCRQLVLTTSKSSNTYPISTRVKNLIKCISEILDFFFT